MDNVHTLERKPALIKPPPAAEAFYSEVLQLMAQSGFPFLVSGTYALASYTGIDRPTKDVDVFAKAGDALKMLHYFKKHGFDVEFAAGARDANGDFAAVGYENALKHLKPGNRQQAIRNRRTFLILT